MFGRHKRAALAVGAAALVVLGVFATTALAQTPTPTAGNQAGGQRTNYHQVFLGKLAGILGVDQAKLEGAIKDAAGQTVDQAVQNGDLGKNQADRIKQRIQNGPGVLGGFGFGPGRGRGPRGGLPLAADLRAPVVQQALADKLGLSVQDLQTQLRSGKSLGDLAKEKNVSEQTLKDAAYGALKTRIDQAVQNKQLTQQQADNILQRAQQQIQQGNWLSQHWNGKGGPKGSPRGPAPSATPTGGTTQ